ncbi:MAG: DNA polymerase IV [Candidatus Pacebacteria bacterium]|nr:DNA polymerase IV [Candidatus Paceibacterota bacterium]
MNVPNQRQNFILHVDGDAFFAMCEVSRRPDLRGKPVVTGRERGIVTAATYEAKALGISRATPIHVVRSHFPQVTVLPSDYELYATISKRMYAITRRHAPLVEEYGVDECFADLSHVADPLACARAIKEDLQRELNMTFSLGMGPTKVLAKLASKHEKPNGFCVVTAENRETLLRNTPAAYVWGIGPQSVKKLVGMGIHSSLEFVQSDRARIERIFTKPMIEVWEELRGNSVLPVDYINATDQKSVQRTRTFTPPTRDPRHLFSELSQHTEHGCRKIRRLGLVADSMSFFLKTQDFRYQGGEIRLLVSTSSPGDILPLLRSAFLKVYKKNILYRATGITLHNLHAPSSVQQDLFDTEHKGEKNERLMIAMDRLEHKYGDHTLYLGTSARSIMQDRLQPAPSPIHTEALIHTDKGLKRFPIPYLGSV